MSQSAFLNYLTDDELRLMAGEAYEDVQAAAEDEPNSNWHDACFAALYLLCEEMNRRGMKPSQVALK